MRRAGIERKERYFSLAEVAELMGLKHQTPRRRREYVQRVVRRLEKRDGSRYLRTFGAESGKLFIAMSALEQIFPWDPSTLKGMDDRIAQLNQSVRGLKGEIRQHANRISNIEKRSAIHTNILNELAKLAALNGA